VILEYDYTDDELLHLFSHDSDPVNRWEAGQRLAMDAC
jgi:aminopeptidase N